MAFKPFEFRSPSISVAGIAQLEGYLSDEHTVSMALTEYPVETGASLVDHAVREPFELALEAYVSGVRRGVLPDPSAQLTALENPARTIAPDVSVSSAFAELVQIMNQRQLLRVSFDAGVYTDMMLVSLRRRRDASRANGLRVSLVLRELQRDVQGGEPPAPPLAPLPGSVAANRPMPAAMGALTPRELFDEEVEIARDNQRLRLTAESGNRAYLSTSTSAIELIQEEERRQTEASMAIKALDEAFTTFQENRARVQAFNQAFTRFLANRDRVNNPAFLENFQ